MEAALEELPAGEDPAGEDPAEEDIGADDTAAGALDEAATALDEDDAPDEDDGVLVEELELPAAVLLELEQLLMSTATMAVAVAARTSFLVENCADEGDENMVDLRFVRGDRLVSLAQGTL